MEKGRVYIELSKMAVFPYLLILTSIILTSFRGECQDIVFINESGKPDLKYLDTSIVRDEQKFDVNIESRPFGRNNTMFFNGLFHIKYSAIGAFKIRESFLQHLVIEQTEFLERNIRFSYSAFDTLSLVGCEIQDSLVFDNVQVQHLLISGKHQPGLIRFFNCKVNNMIFSNGYPDAMIFENCALGDIKLTDCGFYNRLVFRNNTFERSITLTDCIAENRIEISHSNASAGFKLNINALYLPDTLDLSNNFKFGDSLDFKGVSLGTKRDKCKLLIQNTDLSALKLDYSNFELAFEGDVALDQKEVVYSKLLEVFKSNMQQLSYKGLDIEYKRFHAKQGTFGFLWWVPDYWWKYGYERERIFKIVFFAVLLLTVLNYFLINYLTLKVYSIKSIPAYYKRHDWNRLWYSFVYTSVIFFSLSLKTDRIRFQEKLGSVYILIMFVFGTICLAYVANYLIQA